LTHTTLFPEAAFEIEFRCGFATEEEAFTALPFLKASLTASVDWTDAYYGYELFRDGEVLRFAGIVGAGGPRYSLGWKGVDTGTFANVRPELDEDVTTGTRHSRILAALAGEDGPCSLPEIVPALEAAGHFYFMSYSGRSLVGRHEPLGLSTKLMRCDMLRWPLLVELEKLSATETEAERSEQELQDICRRYGLERYVVREEPGALLYEVVFGERPPSVL
jgi:adenylate cyclase class IV